MNRAVVCYALLIALVATSAFAQGRPRRPRVEAERSALEAKLIAKTDTYTIPAGQQGKEFAEKLKAPALREPPEPPAVDLVFEITNPTDKPIKIMVDSDAGALDLKLEGPGAVMVEGRQIFTREYRIGKEVEIAPGKSLEMPIKALRFGFRGVAQHAYWTEPGEYKLFALYRWPDPSVAEGEKPVILQVTAEPVTLIVKASE